MNKIISATVSVFVIISIAHAADSVPITPGLWEIKGTTTNPFSGSKSYTNQECMTEDAFDPSRMMEDMPKDACELNSSVSGNTISYDMNCSMQGQQMTGNGTFTVNGDTAKGEMIMKSSISGQTFEMTMESNAKRIGDC